MADEPVTKTNKNDASSKTQGTSDSGTVAGTAPAPASQSERREPTKERKYRKYVMWPVVAIIALWACIRWILKFFDSHSASFSALATVAIVALTYVYVEYSKKQWEIAKNTLQLSQRAYVTLGKKDGAIADFVIPKDPNQNAEIVIYFQNSGHLPAEFAWGTVVPFLAEGGEKKSTGITYTHPYQGFSRIKDRKTGSVTEQGESSQIAGDSVLVSTLGVISQKDLADLPANNMGTLIIGMYEYCDELGNLSIHNFGLRYRSNAPSSSLSFDLAKDMAFPVPQVPPPSPSSSPTEVLAPCETISERQR
jgi:hypothetical protein